MAVSKRESEAGPQLEDKTSSPSQPSQTGEPGSPRHPSTAEPTPDRRTARSPSQVAQDNRTLNISSH
ncbi:hypothetical protein CapIbe_022609 [Capra ibex]